MEEEGGGIGLVMIPAALLWNNLKNFISVVTKKMVL